MQEQREVEQQNKVIILDSPCLYQIKSCMHTFTCVVPGLGGTSGQAGGHPTRGSDDQAGWIPVVA